MVATLGNFAFHGVRGANTGVAVLSAKSLSDKGTRGVMVGANTGVPCGGGVWNQGTAVKVGGGAPVGNGVRVGSGVPVGKGE